MSRLVAVTGGAGFIGSHLTERLLARGYRVRVLDNLSFGKREWVPAGAEFIEGDIQNQADCQNLCQGAEGVFHLAAMSRAGPSMTAVELCMNQNAIGTQNMLLAAKDQGVKRFVYSASSTYYGNQPGPHGEDMKPDLLNFYAMSKYFGEELCHRFDAAFDLPTVSLRYFNVYGPRQPTTGAYALVLGIFLSRWAKGEILEIHGEGAQRRDFIHVRDIADANIAAFESTVRDRVYNVGFGENISIKELANMISDRQVHGPRRAGDAEVTLADITRITSDLDWRPTVPFAEGLEELRALAAAEAKATA